MGQDIAQNANAQHKEIIIIVKLWNKSLSVDFYLANQKYVQVDAKRGNHVLLWL